MTATVPGQHTPFFPATVWISYLLKSADYIIIGGGLAGCTLASRLHEGNPGVDILIAEAGPDVTSHPLTTGMLCSPLFKP